MSKYTGEKDNEIFVGNVLRSEGIASHLRHIPSARLGDVALSIDGERLPDHQPLFIDRGADALEYDRVMMRRISMI